MGIKVINQGKGRGPVVVLRCPSCGRDGTFEQVGVEDINVRNTWFGQRRCPNNSCYAHIFFIQEGNNLIATFPPQRIDFEKQNIPDKVLSVFEEAITCHADQCYIASAIMIRKTLEEICIDRGATGDNLKKRIQALSSRIVIPKELFEGMDELRLLGNDAAHFESRIFDKISKEEVEVGIEFTKEILKAVYQYAHLLNKLRSLKKSDAGKSA